MDKVNVEGIPHWLRNIDRWILWRDIKGKKVPISVNKGRAINVTKKGMGWSFDEAVAGLSQFDETGLGLILNGGGLVAVDLDDCLDEHGGFIPGVQELLMRLGGGYVEISPSGKGLHVFGYSDCGHHSGINTQHNGLSVEMYFENRYLTVTGNRARGCNENAGDNQIPGYESLLFELNSNRSGHVKEPIQDQLTQETQVFQAIHEFEDNHDAQASGGGLSCEIKDLPFNCLVHVAGQRNKACFELARWVKGKAPDSSRDELQVFVKRWHEYNLTNMGTKDFEETWIDFLYGLNRVNSPYGQSMAAILAELPDLPVEMRAHGFGEKGTVLLRLCLGLAQRSLDGIFYLSGHVAAQHLNCTPQWVYKLISLFVADGFVEIISKGVRSKASEYRMTSVGMPSTAAHTNACCS